MERLRVVLRPWHGWSKKYRVQILLNGSLGIGKFWYDVSDVTPYGPTGFKTKSEANSHMKAVSARFSNG